MTNSDSGRGSGGSPNHPLEGIGRTSKEGSLDCQTILLRERGAGLPRGDLPRRRADGRRAERHHLPGDGRTGQWLGSTVRHMANNETYRGLHRYGIRSKDEDREVIETPCVALVDEVTWQRAKEGLQRNFRHSKRNSKAEYLGRSLGRCAHCGCTYVGTVQGGVVYYVCNGRMMGNGCKSKQVKGADLEAALWGDLQSFAHDPGDALDELVAEMAAEGGSESVAARLKAQRSALAGKDAQREKVLGQHEMGIITDDELKNRHAEIEVERSKLRQEVEWLEDAAGLAREQETQMRDAKTRLRELRRRIDGGLDFAARRKLVENWVEGFEVATVEEGGERWVRVTVHYAIAASTNACSPIPSCRVSAAGCW
ncbi:MAG TPA: recombinase zinc beta ribbon domain-containing protein [Candidatus Eisenbacteria bacterium]|nr:recombinase zinc beta ribbon domain-containing protein [Candidatus Eisenbacteria bacterium]